MTSFTDLLLSLWRLSWFGIIGGFLFVAVAELRHESPHGGGVAHFTGALLFVVVLSWITYFVARNRLRPSDPMIARLLTVMGSVLALFTLLATYFLVTIASRLS